MIETLKELVDRHFPGWTPSVIADIGSHDGAQSVELATTWPLATVLAVECCPTMYPICRDHVASYPNIQSFHNAASTVDGEITFHQSAYANKGAGSIYRSSGNYPGEHIITKEITVMSVRLDTLLKKLGLTGVDLMWLDAQGGELEILMGLGDLISSTRVVYTEYMMQPMYAGQPLVGDLAKYLASKGFEPVWNKEEYSGWWGDACFVRK